MLIWPFYILRMSALERSTIGIHDKFCLVGRFQVKNYLNFVDCN